MRNSYGKRNYIGTILSGEFTDPPHGSAHEADPDYRLYRGRVLGSTFPLPRLFGVLCFLDCSDNPSARAFLKGVKEY